jgi:ElaB/YqjD/DUF883 family membrane-anchored ribosome-binding protein
MGQGPGQERAQQLAADDSEKSAAQLRAEIEDVREELGDTAAALAAKTDVKARARERKDELVAKARQKLPGGDGRPAAGAQPSPITRVKDTAARNPVPTAALGALVGGILIGRLTRRG